MTHRRPSRNDRRLHPRWSAMCRVIVAAAAAGACGGSPRPAALLLVTVDTLRADHLGSYGNALGLTPNLDRLAAGSERFTAAYAATPLTLPSLSALMSGRYPEQTGAVDNSTPLPGDVSTLAAQLHAQRWHTGAVVSSYIVRPGLGLDRGFDAYDASYPSKEAHRDIPERTARDTTDAALRMLDRLADGRAPVFLWVHFQDPHGPYTPPGTLRTRYLAAERRMPDAMRWLPVLDDDTGVGGIPRYQYEDGEHEVASYRARYDGEVAYVDEQIGRLLAGCRRRLSWDRTVVVFAADHGEGMGAHDYWFAHGEFLRDGLVRVPLLVRVPGRTPAVRRDVASLVDLVPTLARALGSGAPGGLPGRDLLAPGAEAKPGRAYLATPRAARYPRVGVVAGGLKYRTWISTEGRVERLARLGDDDEDILDQEPENAQRMRAVLASIRPGPTPTVPRRTPTPDERRRLGALGYAATD